MRVFLLLGTLTLGLTFVSSGCSREGQSMDAQQLERLTQLRSRLQRELGERYDDPVPEATPEQLQRGGELYARLCAPCHGGRGKAKGEVAEGIIGHPTDFTDPRQARFFSEQARLYIIRKGVPGTPMMGWEKLLSEEDLVAVYLYVRSLAK